MIKKITLILGVTLFFVSCSELQQVVDAIPTESPLSSSQISGGLKEALSNGVTKQVISLKEENGFYSNPLVKINVPNDLVKVESTLRKLGLGNLADQGIKSLNRAAEDAVSNAIPVFVDAIKTMSIADAKKILLGNDNAATQYLESSTNSKLYSQFYPIINDSFSKVGADKIWSTIITKYNSIPLTSSVNPNLTDYVAGQALKGVYAMIAKEELSIRNNLNSRTSDLLKKVFKLQDKI